MSQFTSTNYEVDRPSGQCALSDQAIEPGDSYYATLAELTDEEIAEAKAQMAKTGKNTLNPLGLKRVDVSIAAWDEGKRPQRLFSFWKTVQPEPNARRNPFVDDTVLMALLKRLDGEQDLQKQAFRYVLALLLMRKKMVRYDGLQHTDDGTQIWKLTPKKDVTKGHFGKWDDIQLLVVDPGLDESSIGEVTEQLGEILDGDL